MAQNNASSAQAVSQYPEPPLTLFSALYADDALPLAPPNPPKDDESYNMFGRVYATTDRLPSLQECGRPCLYDETKPISEELQRLNRSLLTLFSSLVVSLSTPSGTPGNAVARIEDVFVNMHHLLNILRPAQAVKDLQALLISQTESRLRTARQLKEAVSKAKESISKAALDLQESTITAEEADAVSKSIKLVQDQMHKPFANICDMDKLGWFEGLDKRRTDPWSETSRPRTGDPDRVDVNRRSGSNRNPNLLDVDNTVLEEFARIVGE